MKEVLRATPAVSVAMSHYNSIETNITTCTYNSKTKSIHFGCDDSPIVLWRDVAGRPHHSGCASLLCLLDVAGQTKVTNLRPK